MFSLSLSTRSTTYISCLDSSVFARSQIYVSTLSGGDEGVKTTRFHPTELRRMSDKVLKSLKFFFENRPVCDKPPLGHPLVQCWPRGASRQHRVSARGSRCCVSGFMEPTRCKWYLLTQKGPKNRGFHLKCTCCVF